MNEWMNEWIKQTNQTHRQNAWKQQRWSYAWVNKRVQQQKAASAALYQPWLDKAV